jgi:hypothetical protein
VQDVEERKAILDLMDFLVGRGFSHDIDDVKSVRL